MSNKMVIERNLLESVLFEDDSKGKQIAEKMKKYAKGIVDKITELGNVLKKKKYWKKLIILNRLIMTLK